MSGRIPGDNLPMLYSDDLVSSSSTGSWPEVLPSLLACLAVALPTLLAINLSPSVTFLNQALALGGWGAFLVWVSAGLTTVHMARALRSAWPVLVPLVLLACGITASSQSFGLPASLALSSFGMIFAAILVLVAGAAAIQSRALGGTIFGGFCIALALSGFFSLLVASVQYFRPEWVDGVWMAVPSALGRVGANLRQPNHLSSLLLWSMAAVVWLHEHWCVNGRAPCLYPLRGLTALLMAGLVLGVVLTVSRTGTVCIVLLALWGVLDKRLSRFSRVLLWLLPLIYVMCWMGVAEWAQTGAHAFAGDDQLHKSDLSSSRFGIWSNTLSLIALRPWTGVGWGEFNFAWTLTPFPGRSVAFFDHTHNLPLQFLVELGLPIGTVVLALLGWALWKAFSACRQAPEGVLSVARCAFVMVLMMVVHSMLEYPLWYAYFLLPTAFAFGVCLGAGRVSGGAPISPSASSGKWGPQALLVASLALTTGAALSILDYLRVVAIFSPAQDSRPLSERIAEGQRSWFFAHHADYAAVTTAGHPSEVMASFNRATHYLLDTRLMLAWARAYAERGDVERARYLAQRLKEFRNPLADDFFAECGTPPAAAADLPFQCTPPSRAFTFEDFRRR